MCVGDRVVVVVGSMPSKGFNSYGGMKGKAGPLENRWAI